MQTNDFEKGIQQQMEEFALVPNDAVWEKVEQRIQREKKQRRIFFTWFVAGLLLLAGSAGAWLYETNDEDTLITKQHEKLKGNNAGKALAKDEVDLNGSKKDIANEEEKKEEASVKVGEIKADEVLKEKGEDDSKAVGASRREDINKGSASKVGSKQVSVNEGKVLRSKASTTAARNSKVQSGNTLKDEIPKLEKTIAGVTKNKADARDVNVLKRDSNAGEEDVVNNSKQRQDQVAVTEAKKDTTASIAVLETPAKKSNDTAANVSVTKTVVTLPKKKWRTGITIFGGISDNTKGLAIGSQAKSLSYAANSTPQTSAPTIQKIEYTSALSFGTGVFTEKKWNNKWSMTAGLNYHYYSATMQTGRRTDSLNGAFTTMILYRSGQSVSYKNKYHLIEIPINLQLTVNKNQQKPAHVFAGITPGVLVGSNALYYDQNSFVFYKDNARFNKFRLSMQGGFMFTPFPRSKSNMSIGPMFQYDLNDLTKSSAQTNEHLFFVGLKASFLFNSTSSSRK